MSTVSNNNADFIDVSDLNSASTMSVTSSLQGATVTGTTSVTAQTAVLDEPTLTRGSLRVQGADKGGYNGISLPPPSSGLECLFMNNGTYYGIYNQTDGRWLYYTLINGVTRFYNENTTLFLESEVTGDYGSVEISGTPTTSTWIGPSIGGRIVFMENGSSNGGIYNDTDNRWIFNRVGNDVTLYSGNNNNTYLQIDNADVNASMQYHYFRDTSSNIAFLISTSPSLTANSSDAINEHFQSTRYYYHGSSTDFWTIGTQTQTPSSSDLDLYFSRYLSGSWTYPAFIQDSTGLTQMNFTGQHPVVLEGISSSELENYEGLIVSCDQNMYENVNTNPGVDSITITESLPRVSISTTYKDTKVFGVISTVEDSETTKRSTGAGAFRTIIKKLPGDFRIYANSVGEGAMWVIDHTGSSVLNSGDYITSSNVRGYGCKQDDDIVHNYTVAKITMLCDFNPQMVYRKKIKTSTVSKEVEVRAKQAQETQRTEINYNESTQRWEQTVYKDVNEVEDYVVDEFDLYDSQTGEFLGKHNIRRKEIQEVEEPVRDEYGRIVWEDDTTTEQEIQYKIRYVNANGDIITQEQYNTGTPGTDVFKACFVGVTYHCG